MRSRSPWHAVAGWGLACTLALCCSWPARAATPDEIDAAIRKAKDFLYVNQHHGNWEHSADAPTWRDVRDHPEAPTGGQWGELTSLATWSLLATGESPQNDQLLPALQFLHGTALYGVYAMGARAQSYQYLPETPEVKLRASDDLKALIHALYGTGLSKGFYGTSLNPSDDAVRLAARINHTVSVYGVLGVLACEQVGAEVPINYWRFVEDGWSNDQDPSGAWTQNGRASSDPAGLRASITAAGLSMLYITQDHLHADNGVECKGNVTSPHIDAGLKWLTENFDLILTEKDNRYSPYGTLFDVERVGEASGRKYLGFANWYDTGADYLTKTQALDGSWNKADLTSTCFALLFLSHGRSPVVLNKLQYEINGVEGNWDERPRDGANLVRYIGEQTERELKWQIVNLDAPLHELHDAPILYIAGNKALHFTDDQQQKLKQFCQEGGMIVGNADGASAEFATSFRDLGAAMFPEYEFRELPETSPVFTSEQYRRSTWARPPSMLALSNGVREMMVLYPDSDPARSWQLEQVTGRESLYQSADDLFLYATDKQNLTTAAKSYVIEPDTAITPTRRIKLARLRYDGNDDPEPAGWRRLAALLHNECDVRLDTLPVKLGVGKLGSGHGIGAHVAHLTGTTRFHLGFAARAELKRFVQGGGTLIIDAAGGNSEFADAARDELVAIFGDDAARELSTPVLASNPLFYLSGGNISDFSFRSFGQNLNGALHGPQLRVMTINHRPAVIYSREDLSAGLVGEPIDGITGYDPATATAIMRNLVIYGGLGPGAPVIAQAVPANRS